MKKTIIISVILMIGFITIPVFSAPIEKPVINMETGNVKIYGSLGEEYASRRITLIVTSGENSGLTQPINWFDTAKTDVSGNYEFGYIMEGESGIYNVKISIEKSSDTYNANFLYLDTKTEPQIIWNKIQNGKANRDPAVIDEIIKSRADYLQLELSVYNSLTDASKTSVRINVYDVIAKLSDIKTAISDLADVWALNEKTADNIQDFTNAFNQIKGDECRAIDGVFANFQAEQKKSIYKAMIDINYNGKAELLSDYTTRVILTGANSAKVWGEMYTLLSDVKDVLKIDFNKYNLLNDKIEPISEILNEYNNVDDIVTAFKKAVDRQYDEEQKSIRKDSGSSGGGGGRSVSIPMTSKTAPAVPASSDNLNDVFVDIDEVKWAHESIKNLLDKGIISRDSTYFNPNKNVTRAEFVKMIACSFDFNEIKKDFSFSDVTQKDWFYEYVKKAYAAGIVNGMSTSSFMPEQQITRQDMAVVLYGVLKKKTDISDRESNFIDNASISGYAKASVGALCQYKIINGFEDGTFRPFEAATRAEAATIISSIIKYVENQITVKGE